MWKGGWVGELMAAEPRTDRCTKSHSAQGSKPAFDALMPELAPLSTSLHTVYCKPPELEMKRFYPIQMHASPILGWFTSLHI
jgi:hypothetical protein